MGNRGGVRVTGGGVRVTGRGSWQGRKVGKSPPGLAYVSSSRTGGDLVVDTTTIRTQATVRPATALFRGEGAVAGAGAIDVHGRGAGGGGGGGRVEVNGGVRGGGWVEPWEREEAAAAWFSSTVMARATYAEKVTGIVPLDMSSNLTTSLSFLEKT